MTIKVLSLALGQIDLKDFWARISARERCRHTAWPGAGGLGGCRHLRLIRKPDFERSD